MKFLIESGAVADHAFFHNMRKSRQSVLKSQSSSTCPPHGWCVVWLDKINHLIPAKSCPTDREAAQDEAEQPINANMGINC